MIYQIFVDRFAKSDQKMPVKPWDSPVEGAINEFYGGNIRGIISKADYISSLGADAIYLTPIFSSHTYHRYDILDYFKIDPVVGNEDDFDEMIRIFHSKNIKVFLDGVFNHVNVNSEMADKFGTKNRWRNFDLVELDLDRKDVMNFIIEVVEYWMKRQIDGFRIDCANDIGMKHLDKIMETIHHFNGEMIGEVMTYAKDWMYHMDGVMNYFFRKSTLSLLRGELSVGDYITFINWMIEEYPYDKLLKSWTILSSHDTPRLSYVLGDERRVRLGIAIQYAFPGIPMVYYGEEIEMSGGPDPFNRAPMRWDQKSERIDFYRQMENVRKKFGVLSKGRTKIFKSGSALTILRYDSWEDFVIFTGNISNSANVSNIMIPYSYAFDGLELVDALNPDRKVKISSGSIIAELEPFDFAFFVPQDNVPSYTFFKHR